MLGVWATLVSETILLGVEAQSVIGIRLAQIACGRGTAAETQLMVSEKILAAVEAATTVATGGSVHAVVRAYREKVQANDQRLRTVG